MESSDHDSPPARQESVYRKLIRDPGVTHGAFRLWHYLRDRANAAGKCWPEQRTIAREMHCKCHSLPAWIERLEAGGYLRTEIAGQNHHTVYTVLDGGGRPFSRDAQKGNTRRCPKRRVVMPEEATPRVSPTGNVSKPNEVNSGSKGELRSRERWQIERDMDAITQRLEQLRQQRAKWKDQHGVEHCEGKPTVEAQGKIAKLKVDLEKLQSEWDDAGV